MEISEVIAALEANGKVFETTLTSIPVTMVSWKLNAKDWCPLEIICHLLDEEREDFRARVKHALETPNSPLVPFDPIGLMTARDYMGSNFNLVLQQFLEERKASISWLRRLKEPNWENKVAHPSLGEITARSFLYNWLAHDYHHIRQINNLKHAFLKENSQDPLAYAGKW